MWSSNQVFHIESVKARRVQLEHIFQWYAPNFQATEWHIHVSQAPSYVAQSQTRSSAEVETSRLRYVLEPAIELSVLRRSILSLRFPANNAHPSNSFRVRVQYETMVNRRRFVPGPPVDVVTDLTPEERGWYLASTDSLDFDLPEMQSWTARRGLIRKIDESSIAFAHRVLVYMKQHFHWVDVREFDPGHTASRVCNAMRGDCAKLSLVYVALLRANGVPSRILGIRSLPAGNGHIMTEFFEPTVGWVPVDVLVDPDGESYFTTNGRDVGFGLIPHDYFVHYLDDGFRLPAFEGVIDILGLHSVAWDARGEGTFEDLKIAETWRVVT